MQDLITKLSLSVLQIHFPEQSENIKLMVRQKDNELHRIWHIKQR